MFCTNCASPNHLASDCSKPRRAVPFAPPAPPAIAERKPAAVHPAIQPSAAVVPRRMKGMPPVCAASMLLFFQSEKAAAEYQSAHCPDTGSKVAECSKCGGYHLVRPPEKEVENATGWRRSAKPFLREQTRREMDERIGRLCVAEDQRLSEPPAAPAKEERQVALPRRKPKASEPTLF